jgi:hypothetical protein
MDNKIDLEKERLIRELKKLAEGEIDSDFKEWPKAVIKSAINSIKEQE